jgi:hypothetical protein
MDDFRSILVRPEQERKNRRKLSSEHCKDMSPDADTLEEAPKIAEESPLDSHEKEPVTVRSERTKWYALGIFVVCCALLAIILPTTLVLSNKSDSSGVGVEVASEDPEIDSSNNDTRPSFLLVEGPFQANLTLFNEGIVGQPYADPALLQQDLENAGRFFLNNVVNRNTNVKGFENVGFGGQNPNSGGIPEIGITSYDGYAAYDTISASSPVAEASAQGPAVGNTVNDFGTNNQEQDVEEGDVIVSDGERGKWLWADQGFTRILAVWMLTSTLPNC